MADRTLAFEEGRAPRLAVDAVTGQFHRGEHQVVLAQALARIDAALGAPSDPRFLAETDAAALGVDVPEDCADACIDLRPYRTYGPNGDADVSGLAVVAAALIDGMADTRPEDAEPLTTGALDPQSPDPDMRIVAPGDCGAGGIVTEFCDDALGTDGDPDETAAARGMAVWLLHGAAATPPDADAAAAILDGDAALRRIVRAGGQACRVANAAQRVADEAADELILRRTGGRRDRADLERMTAERCNRPFADLHGAERNPWRMRNPFKAAADPFRSFAAKAALCSVLAAAGVPAAADDGVRFRPVVQTALGCWLDRADSGRIDCRPRTYVGFDGTIDWTKALARGAKSLRDRAGNGDARDAAQTPARAAGLRTQVARRAGGDCLESVHETAFGDLLIGCSADRLHVEYAAMQLKRPLGRRDRLTVNGTAWKEIPGSRGMQFYAPNPAVYDLYINEPGGTNLTFRIDARGGPDRETTVEDVAFGAGAADAPPTPAEFCEAAGDGATVMIAKAPATPFRRMMLIVACDGDARPRAASIGVLGETGTDRAVGDEIEVSVDGRPARGPWSIGKVVRSRAYGTSPARVGYTLLPTNDLDLAAVFREGALVGVDLDDVSTEFVARYEPAAEGAAELMDGLLGADPTDDGEACAINGEPSLGIVSSPLGDAGRVKVACDGDVPLGASVHLFDDHGLEQGDVVPIRVGATTATWVVRSTDAAGGARLVPSSPEAVTSVAAGHGQTARLSIGPDVHSFPIRFEDGPGDDARDRARDVRRDRKRRAAPGLGR